MNASTRALIILRSALVCLVLITPALLAWHRLGMQHVLAVDAKRHPMESNDDRPMGGRSAARLIPNGKLATLECELDTSYAWPYCEVSMKLAASPRGIDLSRYDSVRFRLHYEGPEPRSVRFYLRNYEEGLSNLKDARSLKYNEVEFNLPPSGEMVVPIKLFRIASWWAVNHDVPLMHTDTRIDNVPVIELATGSKIKPGFHRIDIQSIEFEGKWLSQAQLLMLLVGAWLLFGVAWLWVELLGFRTRLIETRKHLKRVESLNQALQLEAKELAGQARTDPLTGALNREGLREFLLKQWPGQTAQAPALSLVFADIDHFKRINDGFGHACGDQVLQQFAKLIRSEIRSSDRLVRWGGEEFLVVCPGAQLQQGRGLAEKLRHSLERCAWPSGVNVTASFGVAVMADGEDFGSAIERADNALYRAKSTGRNRVEVAPIDG